MRPHHQRPDGDGRRRQTTPLPKAEPISYFVDGDRTRPNPALAGVDAEKLARETSGDIPASQIRRLYADVSAFDRRLSIDAKIPAEAIQMQMTLLKAKAAYASGRRLITEPLLQFFINHAAAVKDRTDFFAFRHAFEALIAYHKYYRGKDD